MQPRYIHSTNHANFTCFSVKMSVSYSLTTILPLHNVLNLLYHSIKQKANSVYTETHTALDLENQSKQSLVKAPVVLFFPSQSLSTQF